MKATKTPAMIEILRSEKLRPVLQSLSGSDDFDFCITLLTQVVNAQWRPDSAELTQQVEATRAAMMGMKPRDALEGMLIGQLIAIHNAAMECCRRAMIPGQTFEGGREALNGASHCWKVQPVDPMRFLNSAAVRYWVQNGMALISRDRMGPKGASQI